MSGGVGGLQLTGTASIAEDIDKKMLVVLRDGRKIVGTLRTFDQFSNIVLEHAIERIIVGHCFADVPLGLYVVRGDAGATVLRLPQVASIRQVLRRRQRRCKLHVDAGKPHGGWQAARLRKKDRPDAKMRTRKRSWPRHRS